MNESLSASILFHVGPLQVSTSVVTTWALMAGLTLAGWLMTHLPATAPGFWQTAAESIVLAMEDAISGAAPQHVALLLPEIGALWIFLVAANLCGLIPGVDSPTRDLSVTAALALVVFVSVHWFGIRDQGLEGYLRHYLSPSPILLPFHLISEITRTVALAIRLFGNMMSLEMAALLVLIVAGFLAPVPLLMLHVIEALVQAYIFGVLALIYIAGGMQSQQVKATRTEQKKTTA